MQLTPYLSRYWDTPQSWTLENYLANDGYVGLRNALATDPGAIAEEAVEIAAALAAQAAASGRRYGLVAGTVALQPGEGRGHLERTLDALARAQIHPEAPSPSLPVPPSACVLVGTHALPGAWADLRLASELRPASEGAE